MWEGTVIPIQFVSEISFKFEAFKITHEKKNWLRVIVFQAMDQVEYGQYHTKSSKQWHHIRK